MANKKLVKKSEVAQKNLSFEQVSFKISEINSSILFLTIQSIAVSILALVLFIGAPSVFPEIINPYLPSSLKIMQAIVLVPSIFWIITVLVGLFNNFRIFKLKKSLSSK